MKNILTLIMTFLCVYILSQNKKEYVYLKRETDSTRMFKGTIAGKPVTFFLQYQANSDCSLYLYSVKGWYYYDNFKIKIPLIGYYNGNYTLYNFDKEAEKEFVPQLSSGAFISEDFPQYKNYNEMMKIDVEWENEGKAKKNLGTFTKNGNKQKIIIHALDISVYRENEYLTFPNGKKYNTYDIIDNYAGHQLFSAGVGKNENRILLKYNHSSNHHACGQCGADPGEEGYRMLTFDKNWKLKTIKTFPIYSCLQNIFNNKKLNSPNKDIIIYQVKPESFSTIMRPYQIVVNLKQAFVIKTDL